MHRCKALHFLHLPAFQLKDEISGKVPVQSLNKLSHVGDATSVPCNGFKSVLKNRQSGKAATRKIGWTSFRQKNPIRTDFTWLHRSLLIVFLPRFSGIGLYKTYVFHRDQCIQIISGHQSDLAGTGNLRAKQRKGGSGEVKRNSPGSKSTCFTWLSNFHLERIRVECTGAQNAANLSKFMHSSSKPKLPHHCPLPSSVACTSTWWEGVSPGQGHTVPRCETATGLTVSPRRGSWRNKPMSETFDVCFLTFDQTDLHPVVSCYLCIDVVLSMRLIRDFMQALDMMLWSSKSIASPVQSHEIEIFPGIPQFSGIRNSDWYPWHNPGFPESAARICPNKNFASFWQIALQVSSKPRSKIALLISTHHPSTHPSPSNSDSIHWIRSSTSTDSSASTSPRWKAATKEATVWCGRAECNSSIAWLSFVEKHEQRIATILTQVVELVLISIYFLR